MFVACASLCGRLFFSILCLFIMGAAVFIPTKTAFDNYGVVEGLMEDEDDMQALFHNHVVSRKFLAED